MKNKTAFILLALMATTFAAQMPINTFLSLTESQIAAYTVPTFQNLYYVNSNPKAIMATYNITEFVQNSRIWYEPTTLTMQNKTISFAIPYADALSCYNTIAAATCYNIFVNSTTATIFQNNSVMSIRQKLTARVNAEKKAIADLQLKITGENEAVLTIPMATLRTMISKER